MRAGSSVRLASLKAAKKERMAPSGVEGSIDGEASVEGGSDGDRVGVGPIRPRSRTPATTRRAMTTPVGMMKSGRLRSGMRFMSRPRRCRAIDRERHDGPDPGETEERDAGRRGDLD